MSSFSQLLQPNEKILRTANCRPSISTLIVMSILLFGIPTFYYLYSIRKQPIYLITDERILEVKSDKIECEIMYDDVKQIQIGKSWPEKFDGTGHIILPLGGTKYLQLQYVYQYEKVAEEISSKIE